MQKFRGVYFQIGLLVTVIVLIFMPETAYADSSQKNFIIIETETTTLTLYVNNKPYKSYKVAIGKPDTPTPIGEWKIEHKAEN